MIFFISYGSRAHVQNISYYLNDGYDLATGEEIIEKEGIDGQRIWLKREKGHKELYQKYNIAYSEPMLYFICRTGYDAQNNAVEFWDRFNSVHGVFFELLQNFDLSPQNVNEIFQQCVRFHREKKEAEIVRKYLLGRRADCNSAVIGKKLAEYCTGAGEYASAFPGGDEFHEMLILLAKNRNVYPEDLPEPFYREVIKYRGDNGATDFLLSEYVFNPSLRNAYMLASAISEKNIEYIFRTLKEKDLLDLFLQSVMPKNLPKMWPIPDNSKAARFDNQYLDAPRREDLLRLIINRDQFFRHIYQQLEKMQR